MASAYRIHNDSLTGIYVYMDSHREDHVIVPNGIAVFVKANAFDRPTFEVCAVNPDNTQGQQLTSMKVGYWDAITASGDYSFNGGELG